jgi:hypothetical protein
MQLDKLQQLLYEAVFHQDETSKNNLQKYIQTPQHLDYEEGLNIYHGSVFGQLLGVLSAIYPICYQLVGEDFFEAMASIFISKYPYQSPDLNSYGGQFAEFMTSFSPLENLPYLADVARLEWYYHLVFQGKNNPSLNFDALNQVSPEKWGNLIFSLPSNSFFLESAYPIHRIWQIHQVESDSEELINLDEGGIKIFLWRDDYDIRMDFPSYEEWILLNLFRQQLPLETIVEYYSNIEHQNNTDFNSLLTLFIQKRWLIDFVLSQ